ncbi:MAG: rhamnulokinase [Clostridia bacterium]|nr:rhamnulokinase [Clostridia bacterium]
MADFKMLAIDLGASSGRGIVGRFDGSKLTLEENHRFSNDPVIAGGTFYWDILRIFFEIKNSIRKCALSADKDIASIGIDTWGVDFGLIDKQGKMLGNPVHYRDARTMDYENWAFEKITKEAMFEKTGIAHINFNSVFQLMSALRANPKAFDQADKLLFIPDLLNYFLTGQAKTEYTVASTGGLLDVKNRNWAMDMIAELGIPTNMFTEIAQPGTVLGKLLPQISEDTGIYDANVVHVAAHDTASAVVSVPAKGDDFIYISSGTWSLMGMELNEPNPTIEAMNCGFTNEGGTNGKIRFLRNIMGLWLEQESKRQWEREGEKTTYDQLSDMAMASEAHKCFINPDDPSFMAPGNLPRRVAEFCEKTGQYVPQTKGEIIRCIFESLALKYRWTVENMDEMMGKNTPFINIVGGGTKEAPLCQFTADACKRPVYAGPTEATSIGNLLVQLMAAGQVKDLSQARQVVRDSFEIKCYEPKDADKWDAAYERFLKLL